jgi:predicted transcriptional regulator
MEEATHVRINPETGQPEVSELSWTPVDESTVDQNVADAEAAFKVASTEVEQLDAAVKNSETALDELKKQRRESIRRKADAESALLKSQAIRDGLPAARKLHEQQLQQPNAEGDGGETSEDGEAEPAETEPQDVSDRINVAV